MRKLVEGFAAAWPTEEWIEREGEFAERMNSYPKYVASRTLSEPLEWNNSSCSRGDAPDAVRSQRLFGGARAELELLDTTRLPNGVAVLDYGLAS